MSLFQNDPVIVGSGGAGGSAAEVHDDVSKPPLLSNTNANLLIVEDRDGNLNFNRNSDSAHSFKITAPTTTFAGGFATFVTFGTPYKNAKGESVAPIVTLESGNQGPSTYISGVSAAGYSLNLPPVSVTSVVRVRVSVKPAT
jgi:hypothetical protein